MKLTPLFSTIMVTGAALTGLNGCQSFESSSQQDASHMNANGHSSNTNASPFTDRYNESLALKKDSMTKVGGNNSADDDSRWSSLPTNIKPLDVQHVEIERSPNVVASRLATNLETSQARLAAQSRHICPKLLSVEVGAKRIERPQEVLSSDHCDYYLYPSKGNRIYVANQPSTLEATLVSPQVHDFTNGYYYVRQADKHTIRLAYTGSEYRNEPLNYDMVVRVE